MNWPIILSFLYLYFKAGYELEVSKIAIFIKMIVELSHIIGAIPGDIQAFNDLGIAISRLNKFLNSRELQKNKQSDGELIDKDVAVELLGEYSWKDYHQREENNKRLKVWKKLPQEAASMQHSTLKASLIDQSESSNNHAALPDADDFVLRVHRFTATRGAVTFVVGKIGSGKSTLLYSVLSET